MGVLGFETFAYQGNGSITQTKYRPGSAAVGSMMAGRFAGESAILWANSALTIYPLAAPIASGWAIVVAKFSTWDYPGGTALIGFGDADGLHINLRYGVDGRLEVWRGNTLIDTSTRQLLTNRFYVIGMDATIHGSAGAYSVWVDGVNDASITATGVNTQSGGSASFDRWLFSSAHTGSQFNHCALLAWGDTVSAAAGSVTTAGIGDVRGVSSLVKTDASAAGTHDDLTPSTGTDHGLMVRKSLPDVATNNSSFTAGEKDSYKYDPLDIDGDDIYAMQINVYAKQIASGPRTLGTSFRLGGTDFPHPDDFELPTDPERRAQVYEQDPDTGAQWLEADVNDATAEVGVEVIT